MRRIASASLLLVQDVHDPAGAEALRKEIAQSLPEELRPLLDEDAGPGSFRTAEETLRGLVKKNDAGAAEHIFAIYLHGSLRARPLVL